ncbi:MAG: transketolase [Planctomycetes bacterium]|nr:transketolase [Planctomycetota bacterium]
MMLASEHLGSARRLNPGRRVAPDFAVERIALDRFAARFPDQFLNAGVAEQSMTAVATGLALEGRTVFTYSIANLPIRRPLEFIRNDAAYYDANVNVVAIGGGFGYGALGISHHATEDLAIMRALPGITLVSPCCNWEVAEAVPALASIPGTTYLRLDKSTAGDTRLPGESFRLGKARTLRDGRDATLIATGGIMCEVLEAARALEESGLSCRVLSMHTIDPLDAEAVFSAVRDTGVVITVEEHTVKGGLGGAVAEVCLEAGITPRAFRRIGVRAGFSSVVGSQRYLRGVYEMDAKAIIERTRSAIQEPESEETP